MEKVLGSSREELICRVGESRKRRMGGFGAFLLPQILRKRAKATEMILLPFLPPFKIDGETLRKRHREAHREHEEGQTGKPRRPESGGDEQHLTVQRKRHLDTSRRETGLGHK